MKTLLLPFCICFTVVSSCKAQQYTFDKLPNQKIIFGYGGGVVNNTTVYTLLKNGQLFSFNSITKESKELSSINKKEAKQLFSEFSSISFFDVNFNHPGNRYHFVGLQRGKNVNQVAWGNTSHKVPEEIEGIYNNLITKIKQN